MRYAILSGGRIAERARVPLGGRTIRMGQEEERPPVIQPGPEEMPEADLPDDLEQKHPEPLPLPGTMPTRGKTILNREEVAHLAELLAVVLSPMTEEERAVSDHACLREMESGNFPIVERLFLRAEEYLRSAPEGTPFNVNPGEIKVLEKSIACAESIGRTETLKTVAAVGGGTALVLLLLL